jgi:DNA-binding MarR family transcriptional regulator
VKSIINSLESRGLIIKVSDPKDKRRKFLDLTKKGNKYICGLMDSIDLIAK